MNDMPEASHRNPQQWMPPITALDHICMLLQYQLDFFLTADDSAALLPDFTSRGCLQKEQGTVEYFLGNDTKVEKWNDLLQIPESDLLEMMRNAKRKRQMDSTPQKGLRRKCRPQTSTPKGKGNCATTQHK